MLLVYLLFLVFSRCDVVPTDGMKISKDTTFVPGDYDIPNGIELVADGITLDMNGALLRGKDSSSAPKNFGVLIKNRRNVTVSNGRLQNYYYGIAVALSYGIIISHMDSSSNWVDPNSKSSNIDDIPWLDINVRALGDNPDRTNLGGGMYWYNVTQSTVEFSTFNDQENGVDMYFSDFNKFLNNKMNKNTGWGLHLFQSCDNYVYQNNMDNNERSNLGDSAGVLLVYWSHRNTISMNSFQFCGDGFFIGNENGCPSNYNLINGNIGSHAGANAFEATFSEGNVFQYNEASLSNYGFWLGYSHHGYLYGNKIEGNKVSGIEIDHGLNFTISKANTIRLNQNGVVLRTDGQEHFPPEKFPCLKLPNPPYIYSKEYQISSNKIHDNFQNQMDLQNTEHSLIYDNDFTIGCGANSVNSKGAYVTWSVPKNLRTNIVGGKYTAGNFWTEYLGKDTTGDGIGNTEVPFNNFGRIVPGDDLPLVKP